MSLKYVGKPRMSDKIRINIYKPTNDKPVTKITIRYPLERNIILSNP